MQKVRERVSEKEKLQIKQRHAEGADGRCEIKVLFEKMDGVYLRLLGKDYKSAEVHSRARKQRLTGSSSAHIIIKGILYFSLRLFMNYEL